MAPAGDYIQELAMNRLLRILERYLNLHFHTVLGELIYCTPGALERYKDIPFPADMRPLEKLLS